MCACDDDFSGGISHDELNSDVCMAITQYEVPQEDFAQCDTNGDGEISLDEAFAALEKYQNEPAGRALTAFNRDNFFSDDGNKNHYNYIWTIIITMINENNLVAKNMILTI